MASCTRRLDVEGISLASVAALLLKSVGSGGVTTVELANLLGLDNKRSGKILAVRLFSLSLIRPRLLCLSWLLFSAR